MELVAILRIKDAMSTIDECLGKLSEIADEIIVLDNGSTDGTLEAYKRYPKVVKVLTAEGFDEGRDKIMLHEAAKEHNPDWILWCDADEVFEKHFTREVVEKYMRSKYNRVSFRMVNFWLGRERFRVDGIYYLYTLHPQRSMWRNSPEAYFRNRKIHNGDIMGVPKPHLVSPYRLKHYGYVDRQKIKEKINLYKGVDTSGAREYLANMDLNKPHLTFRYIEFDNYIFNRVYIEIYKLTCNLVWLLARVWNKISRSR